MMLMARNATVTVCHTRTKDVPAVAREADILVSAAGVLRSLTKEYVRPGQIVIDVSINWTRPRAALQATRFTMKWNPLWMPLPRCPAVWAA